MKRNNHTTSTKCQYQAEASNPKWCLGLREPNVIRNIVAIKNNVPTRTCKPWNPVATKNVLPNEESEIVKGASTYSRSWINVK